MKYVVDIEIDLPINRVVELFDNPDNMPKWQPDLVGLELMTGVPGQAGTKSKLLYKMGKRDVEMIETIEKNNLPDELLGIYETKGVYNVISNRFEEVSPKKTKWISENEFHFSGVMRVIGLFTKGAFPRQTIKMMNQFKEFAEEA